MAAAADPRVRTFDSSEAVNEADVLAASFPVSRRRRRRMSVSGLRASASKALLQATTAGSSKPRVPEGLAEAMVAGDGERGTGSGKGSGDSGAAVARVYTARFQGKGIAWRKVQLQVGPMGLQVLQGERVLETFLYAKLTGWAALAEDELLLQLLSGEEHLIRADKAESIAEGMNAHARALSDILRQEKRAAPLQSYPTAQSAKTRSARSHTVMARQYECGGTGGAASHSDVSELSPWN